MKRSSTRAKGNPTEEALLHIKENRDIDCVEARFINDVKGRGVFTTKDITKGSFILQYKGRLVKKHLNNEYAFNFKHNDMHFCIDASKDDGSLGRLVNDDPKPNSKMKNINLNGLPHLCLFSIIDIKAGDEITYDYGGTGLPWRNKKKTQKKARTFQPAEVHSQFESPTEEERGATRSVETPDPDDVYSSAHRENYVLSQTSVAQPVEASRPSATSLQPKESPTEEQRGATRSVETPELNDVHALAHRENHEEPQTSAALPVEASRPSATSLQPKECKKHFVTLKEMSCLEKCFTCQGPFSALKWSGLCCKVCSAVWHSRCFHKKSVYDLSESSEEELSSGEEFVPESESDVSSTEIDLESPIRNITENCLEPCMTSEKKSSSLNGTLGDSFIQSPSSSNDSSPSSITEAMYVSMTNKTEEKNTSIPKVTSSDSVSVSHGKTTVSKGGKNFCFLCGKAQNKIARHFKVHENENAEIARAFSFPAHSKKRKELLQALRNKGNFMHNNDVLKKGTGVLKVKRHSVKQDCNKYEYCVYCHGMFVRKELWRHMKRCSAKREHHENHQGRKRVLGLAAVAKAAFSGTVSDGVLKLLRSMRDDEIASVVRHDPCLLQFAQSLYNKHGRDLSRHGHIRQKIRDLGRFLISIRKSSSITTLEDAIKPENFMATVQAAKELAGVSKDEKTFQAPSLALKIGQHLLQVSSIIQCNAIIAGNKELRECTEEFQTLYRAKWTECVSYTARMSAKEKKYNKKCNLPLTEDIQKLTKYLESALDSAYKKLEKSSTIQNYSDLAKVTLTRVIIFNRRRSGEVSKMQLNNFLERDSSPILPEFGLSNYEKRLCSYLSRVEIKGKKDRKVAVLLTPDLVKALQLLVEKRKDCEVFDENGFLFAVPKSLSFFRGHDCIRKFAQESGARHPEYLSSTQLRKQVATTSQILNLKNNEMDQLADFLGHDIRVHREYYRLPAATLQIAKISKMLLALERGNVSELQGRSLDEIQEFAEVNNSSDSEDSCEDEHEQDDTSGEPMETACQLNQTVASVNKECIRTGIVKRPWTKLEEQAVFRHFKSHILKGHLASLNECHSCQNAERHILHSRTPQNIRDFVRNRGTSLRRQNSTI